MTEIHNRIPEFDGRALYSARGKWIPRLGKIPDYHQRTSFWKYAEGYIRDATACDLCGNYSQSMLPQFKIPLALQIIPEKHQPIALRQSTSAFPGKVKSLTELHVAIETRNLGGYTSTADGDRILSFHCQTSDSLVLTTRRLLSYVTEAVMFHSDATYKTVPENKAFCRQLLTLHGNWNGYVGMIACALMTSADTAAYREVFRVLKEQTPGTVCRSYMGDYDAAMRQAAREEFPGAQVNGCLFHYAQALVRKASSQEVNLAKEIRQPGPILTKFLAFTALPLLPATQVTETFQILAEEARQMSERVDR